MDFLSTSLDSAAAGSLLRAGQGRPREGLGCDGFRAARGWLRSIAAVVSFSTKIPMICAPALLPVSALIPTSGPSSSP
ncbi:hypothetical protein VPH35_040701 [Triticum aestivum]